MTGRSGPPGRLGPEAKREIQRELDDALYYLRADCLPCAERHFEKARLVGASEEAIDAVLAKHAADTAVPLPQDSLLPPASAH